MRIEENKVYMFTFQTDSGDLAIPVRGNTHADAGDKLKKMLARMQMELSLEFPKIGSPDREPGVPASDPVPGSVPPEVLELRIDTLLKDMGGSELQGSAKAETIKNWTDLEFVPGNYAKIIVELEMILSGQKEVKPKKKK